MLCDDKMKILNQDRIQKLMEAIHDRRPISGLTHTFYRYPARFSPRFVKAVIETFSEPGEVVYDPFMGGGTTLVEALASGRRAIGTDINSLAVFIAKVKTTCISDFDVQVMRTWFENAGDWLNLRNLPKRSTEWIELGYQKNISGRTTWPIRKILELALANISSLPRLEQQDFIRCVLLRTAQWALDCRKEIPSAKEFRTQCAEFFEEMIKGAIELQKVSKKITENSLHHDSIKPLCLQQSVVGIESAEINKEFLPPRLILTSPPYPGVHVLYHRWQVNGRKETPAPYWITASLDGNGASYYTFGGRKQKDLSNYFDQAFNAYSSLSKIADERTLLVQLVAFSDPSWQLPTFLKVLQQAGFREIQLPIISQYSNERLWRQVPNRKFYANQKGCTTASKEVLLIHQIYRPS
jgi:hypothetical protein